MAQTSQLLAQAIVLLITSLCLQIPTSLCEDQQALLAFKSLLYDPHGVIASWNESTSVCLWRGVKCGNNPSGKRVTRLELPSFGLAGSISPFLGNLSFLQKLRLPGNRLTGQVPQELGSLSRLQYLNLSKNSLEGYIPEKLGNCSSLNVLSLSMNNLQGTIPNTLSSLKLLQVIHLDQNMITGEIPSELGSLKGLTELVLFNNRLSGNIPSSFSNLSSIRHLNISANKLIGEIPMKLGRLRFLKTLDFSNNSLTGRIPPNLGNISSLATINLGINSLFGSVPSALANLSSLTSINLNNNNLSGEIPFAFGNLGSLIQLGLYYNNLNGDIPHSLGKLSKLNYLDISVNNLTGTIPSPIWNLSSLIILQLFDNELSGTLPVNMGNNLPRLETLYLYKNNLRGALPASLANTSLQEMSLMLNMFSGVIPPEIGVLKNVKYFMLSHNMLEAREPRDWEFFNAIINSSSLLLVDLGYNRLQGKLPASVANLSISLISFEVGGNRIWGNIPSGIGNLVNLMVLSVGKNILSGHLPSSLGSIQNLEYLNLSDNNFTGEIPASIGNITLLSRLYLFNNSLSGTIPESIGQLGYLLLLDLSYNWLTGYIPKQVVDMPSLSQYFDLSHNMLIGPVPEEVGNLINLVELHVENNLLSGDIPGSFSKCQTLQSLYLQGNAFQGIIPSSFSTLKALGKIDLSSNNLSGYIPNFFKDFHNLYYLNLSFNNFVGEVPKLGVFANTSAFDIQGNKKLCGGMSILHLQPCSNQAPTKKHKNMPLVVIISVTSFLIFCITIFLFLFRTHYLPNSKQKDSPGYLPLKHLTISYSELANATDGFSEERIIGIGSSGSVYKARLQVEGDNAQNIVAVKVLNLQNQEVTRSFSVECEAIRNLRHRNIIKIITLCSSIDFRGNEFKAIVYEYMPNGSLDDWLHHKKDGENLSFGQRLSIAIDVAMALDYIHHHSGTSIVHRDIKPSNVLLDADMVACVGDFGVAKFVGEENAFSQYSEVSSQFRGTIGYACPEYGTGNAVSKHGDVYSFGILLFEMITGKRPTDDIFTDSLSLREYVKRSMPYNVIDVLDGRLIAEIEEHDANVEAHIKRTKLECAGLMLEVGLLCSDELLEKRMHTEDIINELHAIKKMLQGRT